VEFLDLTVGGFQKVKYLLEKEESPVLNNNMIG
jgi:hypothetical protein